MTNPADPDRLSPRMIVELLYRYDDTRFNHHAWQQEAQLQRRAAQHLIRAHASAFSTDLDGRPMDEVLPSLIDKQMHIPALMLAAYSVELMLKALIIKRDPKSSHIEHHGLVSLAIAAGMQGRLDEGVLEKLTEYSTWRGRYPTSKEPKKKETEAIDREKARIEQALASPNVTFGQLIPAPGVNRPKARHDFSSGPEDYGGTYSVEFFDKAMAIYGTIFDEWLL